MEKRSVSPVSGTVRFLPLVGVVTYQQTATRPISYIYIISSPEALLRDIAVRVLNPTTHPQTYGVTIIFSAFLVIGYLLITQFAAAYRKE